MKSASELSVDAEPTPWPPEAGGWSEDARYTFLERLGVADELGMETPPGSEAWTIAARDARREQARVPRAINSQVVDAVLDALSGMGLTVHRLMPKCDSASTPEDGYSTSRSSVRKP
ncbi:MAG: hypothetical protein H7210_02820 [Pyrinomonadaceae bacterium]|nr:hypothetical protein [Phycisphaerales bacterium]